MAKSRNLDTFKLSNETAKSKTTNWIEKTIQKRECCTFIPYSKNLDKCSCGNSIDEHHLLQDKYEKQRHLKLNNRWTVFKNTILLPTDAYGTIEFMGSPRPYKAQYIKLAYDTNPENILFLLEHVWQLTAPKLIISIHGGHKKFDLQPKLARSFRNGLIKAAKSTNAWIITPGFDTGVVKHISPALEPIITTSRAKSKINTNIVYHSDNGNSNRKSRYHELNNRHSYFLLVDDGTVGKYGSEIVLRRRLESFIIEKRTILEGSDRSVPVVSVMLEGGLSLIRHVLDYVSISPKVPVVICDGSGRASDLLAFAHQNINENGKLPKKVYNQLIELVKNLFNLDEESSCALVNDILASVFHKNMITIYRIDTRIEHEFDYSILTALQKGHNLTTYEQLMLALAWNRVDIATKDIFKQGVELQKSIMYDALMEALIQNKVNFVRLLLEKGVDIKSFLTIERLEELYNSDLETSNPLYYLIKNVAKVKKRYRINLPDIGLFMEKLMRHGYRSRYTNKEFKGKYFFHKKWVEENMNKSNGIKKIYSEDQLENNDLNESVLDQDMDKNEINEIRIDINNYEDKTNNDTYDYFPYPFSDIFIWAVLTQRQDIAICMWEHGEEALVKALIAIRLYKSLASVTSEDYYEQEICINCAILHDYAEEFHTKALELLDLCFKHDDTNTLQLLIYELKNWGRETCLSLAVSCHSQKFLAHPCCQTLLSDLWHGGLQIRSHINIQVIIGLLCPLAIFFLGFKSKEELQLQAQTVSENTKYTNETNESTTAESSPDEWEPEDYEEYRGSSINSNVKNPSC